MNVIVYLSQLLSIVLVFAYICIFLRESKGYSQVKDIKLILSVSDLSLGHTPMKYLKLDTLLLTCFLLLLMRSIFNQSSYFDHHQL